MLNASPAKAFLEAPRPMTHSLDLPSHGTSSGSCFQFVPVTFGSFQEVFWTHRGQWNWWQALQQLRSSSKSSQEDFARWSIEWPTIEDGVGCRVLKFGNYCNTLFHPSSSQFPSSSLNLEVGVKAAFCIYHRYEEMHLCANPFHDTHPYPLEMADCFSAALSTATHH